MENTPGTDYTKLGDLQREIDELDEKSMAKNGTLGRTGTIH